MPDSGPVSPWAVYPFRVKNITLSADEALLEAARRRARAEHTSLNEVFRRWLIEYTLAQPPVHRSEEVLDALRGRLVVGRQLGREELNGR